MVAFVAAICIATPVVVLAQAKYPPPPPTPTPRPAVGGSDGRACFKVDGQVDGAFVPGRVTEGSDIIVFGPEGTAEANGEIEFFVDSRRAKLGQSHAQADGSFSYRRTLPTLIKPGHHRIIGVIRGCGESSVDLEVLASPQVLVGAAVADPSEGSGTLPRTGVPLVTYVLVALILVGIGALLLRVRNGRPIGLARSITSASSEPKVPLLDTSHFVSGELRQRRRAESPNDR